MKLFTEADVLRPESKFPTIYVDREELIDCPLDWQKRGLQQTASGYGNKLTLRYKINFCGRLYRLYCTCYSNCGSVWFTVRGRKIYVE